MTTPYSDVYYYFLPKIESYDFLNMTIEERDGNLETWLNGAITKFRNCKKDLYDKDNTLQQFNIDISEEEKNILGTLMVVEYLSPKLITDDLMKQTLGSKDYKLFSQANHIKELRELRESVKKEVNQMMVDYSYKNGKWMNRS